MKFRFSFLVLMGMFFGCFAEQTSADKSQISAAEVKNVAESDKIKKTTVDKIVVRVNGVNILKSTLEKPQAVASGQRLSLEAAINEELLFQKAAEHKMLATSAEVDKQITSLKIRSGLVDLSDEDFEKELKQEGLTLADYKSQIAKFMAVERLKMAQFSEKGVVMSQEVEEFYKKNPSWSEEKYNLQICDLSESDVDKDGNSVADKSGGKWDDLGWILKKDLNKNLAFVSGMKKGEVCKPVKFSGSYQLVKVVDRSEKNLLSLEQRYTGIEASLQEKKRVAFEKEFESELRKDASIVYLS